MIDAYAVTRQFERELCAYTGAKYAVAVNSCTAAIQLAVRYSLIATIPKPLHALLKPSPIQIPKRTYPSVPMSIVHAGGRPIFRDESWRGAYQLKPLSVWDSARRFTSGMYIPGQFQCVSFSSSKILGIEQGGAILHDSVKADPWFRRMRFDGRTEGLATVDDNFREIGLHVIMLPSIAAQLLLKLSFLPKHNEDLPIIPYPDLSKFEVFK